MTYLKWIDGSTCRAWWCAVVVAFRAQVAGSRLGYFHLFAAEALAAAPPADCVTSIV